ncbi:MAG TPA: hypothetical protein VK524_04620, partial [Polyangiaceae bacterium]|nr:hypothetical protein [Polyangiaceae bacterium]
AQPGAVNFKQTVVGLAVNPVPADAELSVSEEPHHQFRGGTAPGIPRSFPPPAAPFERPVQAEPRQERISVRPNVISSWDLSAPARGTRRTPSPALIVLLIASLALLLFAGTRLLRSGSPDAESATPRRTESVLVEDEAMEHKPGVPSVHGAKPGSSADSPDPR